MRSSLGRSRPFSPYAHFSRQALTHALTNTITGDHIRLKIALVSTSRWLAVAMYGEAQVYQRITQEIMGLCLHRYPPA
ncbi:HutP family protein [Klebsiella pneumoniae]